MPDPIVAQAHAWLARHEQALVDDLRAVLRIPSVESDPEPGAPFGRANREALDWALALGERHGLRIKNLDGYVGYAEYGEGEKLVMVLGHLDVVPVGPGWKHDPFGAEVEDGYIYARGAVDDKGPTMAAFYAALALREAIPDLNARVRVVFGCNEESGFRCIHHYVEHDEAPTYGVAPDSGWPLYHAEAGIANFVLQIPLVGERMRLLNLEGGQRPNIVIDSCAARVRVVPDARAEVEEKLAQSWDRNVEFDWEGDELSVRAIGKAAHGAYPFLGDSAAIRVLRFLREIAPVSDARAYHELFDLPHIGGAGLGLAAGDAVIGGLTLNLGITRCDATNLHCTFNVRYPVDWGPNEVRERVERRLAETGLGARIVEIEDSRPLYFPLEHPMVRAIVDAYTEETGEQREPGAMRGGTYARAVPNTVSIGTSWEGDGPAHETDERFKIEHLHRAARIYANVLHRLVRL